VINSEGGPRYRQLAAILRAEIRTGTIRPGQLVPSETTLHQRYGVSRLTARAAVHVLRAEGLAEHVNGRGVVVREPNVYEDLVPPAGSVVVARMPTDEERSEFDIPAGVPVFTVTGADGAVDLFPADRWQLRWPQ
jgi:DNA-binding transcriptional MocR family regulator